MRRRLLLDEIAVKAWRTWDRQSEPVEILKRHKKRAVAASPGWDCGGAVISKQCPKATGSIERIIYEVLPQLPVTPPLLGPWRRTTSFAGCSLRTLAL
jgi:hypothetical protein